MIKHLNNQPILFSIINPDTGKNYEDIIEARIERASFSKAQLFQFYYHTQTASYLLILEDSLVEALKQTVNPVRVILSLQKRLTRDVAVARIYRTKRIQQQGEAE